MPKLLQPLHQLSQLLQIRRSSCLAFLVVCLGTVGCRDLTTDPIRMNLADQLWDVQIERRAMTMSTVAPYDTITLHTIALNAFGDTIREGTQVRYHSVSDTTVRISEDGVLTVRTPTNARGIKIVASVTYQQVTRTDTALVVVTTHPIPPRILDTIVLDAIDAISQASRAPVWPIAVGVEENPIIVSRVFDRDGTILTVPLNYVSADPSIAVVDRWTGEIIPRLEGTTAITATTTWYGTTYRTTLEVMVIGVMGGRVTIQERTPRGSDTTVIVLTPATLVLETGAVLMWTNESSQPVDILFDDPTNVREITGPNVYELYCQFFGQGCHVGKTGGNVSLSVLDSAGDPFGNMDFRYFPVPGTYHFRTSSGVTGVITVKSSLTPNGVH